MTRETKMRVMKILYDQYWHADNSSKGLPASEREEHAKCALCGDRDSQEHMILSCEHAAMREAREYGAELIQRHFEEIKTDRSQKSHTLARAFEEVWSQLADTEQEYQRRVPRKDEKIKN